IGNFVSLALQPLAGIQHRLVFRNLRNNVIALAAICLSGALDHQVVGFSSTTAKNNFLGRCANQPGNLRPCILDRLFSRPAKRVISARCVSKLVLEVGQHRIQNTGIQRRRRVIVHVNRQLYSHAQSCATATARPLFCNPSRNSTSADSASSSLKSDIVTRPSNSKIPSLMRRSGSRTEQQCAASHSPCRVTQEVIVTGPSIAAITSSALM